MLGPSGTWRVVERRGIATVSSERGRTGDTIIVTPRPGSANDWQITLEYRGDATVSPRGVQSKTDVPYLFSYGRFDPIREWSVSFFALSDSTSPRTPIATQKTPHLDYMWYRPTVPGVPQSNFRIAATADVNLPPGRYVMRTISDDAVRVWVDDKLVIDNWKPHESEVDLADVTPGNHRLRVEYYQLGGWTELRAEILRGERNDMLPSFRE